MIIQQEKGPSKTKFNRIDEYLYTPSKEGIFEMIVLVEKSTGKIKIAFPKKGAEVWVWTELKWEMVV